MQEIRETVSNTVAGQKVASEQTRCRSLVDTNSNQLSGDKVKIKVNIHTNNQPPKKQDFVRIQNFYSHQRLPSRMLKTKNLNKKFPKELYKLRSQRFSNDNSQETSPVSQKNDHVDSKQLYQELVSMNAIRINKSMVQTMQENPMNPCQAFIEACKLKQIQKLKNQGVRRGNDT